MSKKRKSPKKFSQWKKWGQFNTWQCYTCEMVINRLKGESLLDWQERIYDHHSRHPIRVMTGGD